jgi:Hint domain
MSWIALTDLHAPLFNIRGIGVRADTTGARPPMQPDEILPQGTMVMELRYNVDPDETHTLIAYRRRRDWMRELHVTLDGAGNLEMAFRQGRNRSRAAIRFPVPARDSRMRISYAWNAPVRAGLLTVELLDEGRMFQSGVFAPVPLPPEDLRVMVRNGRRTEIAPVLRYLAFSDAVEPVGFGTGIIGGTMVETPDGPRPVERLRLGDPVVTATAGLQPVRWVGKREVPALGAFRPVRLRAPFFGLARDVVMAPDHRVRLDLAEAEYMLGTNEILMPAAHLVNGKHARRDGGQRLVTYHQVLLDVHDCLLHDGVWAESLYVGTIARRPDVARTTVIGEMPASAIPEHRSFARHRLNDFEARSLAATLQQA